MKTTTKFGLKAPYILYEKDCTIQAKNDETVATHRVPRALIEGRAL